MGMSRLSGKLINLGIGLLLGLQMATAAAPNNRLEVYPLPPSTYGVVSEQTRVRTDDPRATQFANQLKESLREIRSAGQAVRHKVQRTRSVSSGGFSKASRSSVTKPGVQTRHAPAVLQGSIATPRSYRVRPGAGGSIRQALPEKGQSFLMSSVSSAAAGLERDKQTAMEFLNRERLLLGLNDPSQAFAYRTSHIDKLGHRHLRFAQRYESLQVYGAEVVMQADEQGNLLSFNGAYSPMPRKFSTQPIVAAAQANRSALLHAGVTDDSKLKNEGRLLIYVGKNGPRLAWHVRITETQTQLWSVFVDALNGQILGAYNEIPSDNVSVSLPDLFGEAKTVNLWEEGPDADSYPEGFYAVDTTKPMYDPASSPPDPASVGGVVMVFNAFNQPATSDPQSIPPLSVAGNGDLESFSSEVVSALFSLSETYDYFNVVHGRNSLDGAGSSLKAAVSWGLGVKNAVYIPDQQLILFGGADNYPGALDVVGHEMTHGVISTSAGLIYQNQSGALNEAFADILGEMVEARTNGAPDWILGSNLNQPVRSLRDPSDFSCLNGPCPVRMSEYIVTSLDNGGVHLNSGIVNHAFYQLAEGLPTGGIGITDAEQIFYRALTTKLTPLSEFIDARLAAIQSAEELFGAGSTQAQKTAEAFDTVEVFDLPSNPVPEPFPGSSGTEDSTLFVFIDPTSGQPFLGRSEAALGDPQQGSFLSTGPAKATRPAVSGDGTLAAFVNSVDDLCLIETNPIGAEQCLGFPGLVYSVAMSPDGGTFGFVFNDGAGNPTNEITVIDIDSGLDTTYQLEAPVIDGATANAIVQADALDFTTDKRYLIYDALNAIDIQGRSVGVWSIYAIDLVTGATLVVVPPILGLDIGFPNVAQTSDFHLAFDVRDASSGANTLYAGNLLTGALNAIATTEDWSVPSYTGDDGAIVYSVIDPGVTTGASLYRQALASDRITPSGTETLWLGDADFSGMYRRGTFTGATRIDLRVVASAAPAVAVDVGDVPGYTFSVSNDGPDEAANVDLIIRHPSGVEFDEGPNGSHPCTVMGDEAVCTASTLVPGEIMEISASFFARVEGQLLFSAGTSADQTDVDTSDNTGFVEFAVSNDSPILNQAIPDADAVVGEPFSFDAATFMSDPNGESLVFSVNTLPPGLQLNSSSGVISGSPSVAGSTSVTLSATDASGASVQDTFVITVEAPTPPPPPPPPSGGGGGGGSFTFSTDLPILVSLALVVFLRRRRLLNVGINFGRIA